MASGGCERPSEAQVRREFDEELTAATEHWQKESVEKKIREEMRKRVKRLVSPYSLYGNVWKG